MKKHRDKQLAIPLEVKASIIKLAITSISILVLGIVMFLGFIFMPDTPILVLLFGIFFIIIGIMVGIICVKSNKQIILRVDETGITYQPVSFGEQQIVGPVLWSDMTDISMKVVSAGKSTQRYLQVQVKNPTDYKLKQSKPILGKFSKFNLASKTPDFTVILAPLSMLKIKNDALLATCQREFETYQHLANELSSQQQDESQYDMTHVQPFQVEADSAMSSPFEILDTNPNRQATQKLATRLTIILIILILVGGGLSYFKAQSKYAGLKNKTPYYLTENKGEVPDVLFSFKIFSSIKAKYPVILFATQYKMNTILNKDNIDILNNVQNQVIQDDKIYALKNDGNFYASYSKYQIKDKQIKMDLIDGAGKYILGDVDYLNIGNIKRDNQNLYYTGILESRQDNKTNRVQVRIYSSADLSKIKDYQK